MDSRVDRIGHYRRLLRHTLPSEARRTLEWLLADAVRVRAAEAAGSVPWERYRAPRLVALADTAVAEAARRTGSQFANMQLYLAAHDTLLLLAYRNFDATFAGRFACFTPDGRTTCSRVIASGRRVALEDIEADERFAPHVPAALSAGFRSLQSAPLKDRAGRPIGVLTTHFAATGVFQRRALRAGPLRRPRVVGARARLRMKPPALEVG